MNEQGLKALENLGAELGAAKAENEKLRGLLRECAGQIDLLIEVYVEDDVEPEDIAISEQIKADIHAALSQQAEPQQSREAEGLLPEWWMEQHTEPSDTYTAVDMATAAAQGFRDGQAAVEQAAAQDEQQPIYLYRRKGQDAFATCDEDRFEELSTHHLFETKLAYAAPIAQTAPQPEQSGLVEALEEIASGLQAEFAWEVAEQALAAYRAALSAQGAGDADS